MRALERVRLSSGNWLPTYICAVDSMTPIERIGLADENRGGSFDVGKNLFVRPSTRRKNNELSLIDVQQEANELCAENNLVAALLSSSARECQQRRNRRERQIRIGKAYISRKKNA